ncbi:MAG: hypothetical protein WD078_04635 [Woeseia sp.]
MTDGQYDCTRGELDGLTAKKRGHKIGLDQALAQENECLARESVTVPRAVTASAP